MNRLILIGPNYAFPRASARPASVLAPLAPPPPLQGLGNFDAGFSSSMKLDAEAAGSSNHPAGPPPAVTAPSTGGGQFVFDSDEEFVW